MGVVNVTPDSFSDGGRQPRPGDCRGDRAAAADEGAALVDIGGESTRPGAVPRPLDEELRRGVVPVLEQLAGIPVSIDTSKAEVARQGTRAGALLVNDVTALRAIRSSPVSSPTPAPTFASCTCRGSLARCSSSRDTTTSSAEVAGFLEDRLAVAVAAGIPEEHVCLDPGIGFGKTPDQNLALIRGLERICRIGPPVLVGLSRKSTLARVLGATPRRPGGRHGRRVGRRGGRGVRPRGVSLSRP